MITWLDESLSADLPSSNEQSLQIKWTQGEETFPLSYDRSSTCVTPITSGGVSDVTESDRLEGKARLKHRWNDGKERTTTVLNEQCCNYSLHLFSSWSLSFQHCLCNRKGNVDSRFHTLTTHTMKKPWRV